MIVNPDKVQAIIVKGNSKMDDGETVIFLKKKLKLLGTSIDNNLCFEDHISTLF